MTLVQITYGVRKHPDHDGWLPVVTERIDEGKPHVSAPWGRPLDEDHALFLAKDTAEHRASRYLGDYTVVVSEAAPERGPRRNPADLVEELDALAAVFADLDADTLIETNIHSALSPILQRHLGYSLGPSADWVNPTWDLGGDLYLFENDTDGEYTVLRRDAESDVIEEVKHLPDFDALRRYFRMRRNPRRKAPPPPPSHTFALEADPYQQGLFAPSSYEAKPKQRAVEPTFVDERQVDMFAPPPAKKNPDHGVKWQKYGPKGVNWEGEWLVTVDGQQFRAWRDPEIDSFWFVPASDTTTSLHGAVFDKKSPAVFAGYSREECVRAMRKFSR